ncbi:MAG: CopD family protein, partial [Janthinobacterium lividum]
MALAAARALSVAGLLSVFGTLLFGVAVAPRAFAGMPEAAEAVGLRLARLCRLGLGVQLAGTLAWLVLQSADMAGAAGVGAALRAVPVVLADTAFGHLVAGQLAGIGVVALAVAGRGGGGAWRRRAACGLAGVAVALQAGHGHAAAMQTGSGVLMAAGVVHLLAAGAWLGGLVPLGVAVAVAPPRGGAMAARWFTPLGKLCVVAVAASAAVQAWVLVGSVPGLVGTGYGWMVLVKLALLGVLLGFAVANRYRFAPALLRGEGGGARAVLLRSLWVQAGFGGAVLLAAAVLGSLPPSMHVAPVWPFAWQPSLDAVHEDDGLRDEVLGAGLALLGAAALAGGAVALRGWARWGALAAAGGIVMLAVPHLDLLFVPAFPTSFQRSPTGFAARSIAQGAALYPGQCAGCHGAQGHGDGPAAAGLAVPPADLTAAHLWMHADGALFWWLSHGIEGPEGGMAMPGFASVLSAEERWALIDYVRAHNAGLVVREAGVWAPPLRAPGFAVACEDAGKRSLADLRGGFVRVVLGTAAAVPGVVTVLATADPAARPGPGVCVAADASVAEAYGVVAGGGVQVLVDGAGWLRAVQGAGGGWDDPARLAATIR